MKPFTGLFLTLAFASVRPTFAAEHFTNTPHARETTVPIASKAARLSLPGSTEEVGVSAAKITEMNAMVQNHVDIMQEFRRLSQACALDDSLIQQFRNVNADRDTSSGIKRSE